MDRFQVTNALFEQFIKETGYVTVAERKLISEDYPGTLPGGRRLSASGHITVQHCAGQVSVAKQAIKEKSNG